MTIAFGEAFTVEVRGAFDAQPLAGDLERGAGAEYKRRRSLQAFSQASVISSPAAAQWTRPRPAGAA
jgi:hypothetical protein